MSREMKPPSPLARSVSVLIIITAVFLLCAAAPQDVWGFSHGIYWFSGNPATSGGLICTDCHGLGGTLPTVTITGPTSLASGASGTYTLTITGGAAAYGGLDVSASAGTLTASDANTQLMRGEITQTASTAFSGGTLSFGFTLTAPLSGQVILYGAGLSANGDGSSGGDNAAKATLTVTVTAPAPAITVTDPVPPPNDLQMAFGTVSDGVTSSLTVTVGNSGNANLVIGSIGVVKPLTASFSIPTDNCSGKTIASSGTCTIVVMFAPTGVGLFSGSFDIPSNDPTMQSVTFNVSGSGNNPPTVPQLVYPANGQTGVASPVTLEWRPSTDLDGDAVNYHVYCCTDSTFATCTPVTVAMQRTTGIYLAFSGLLFAGFAVRKGARGKAMLLILVATLLLSTGIIITACGSSSSVTPPAPPSNVTNQVSGLTSGSTYYWKVVADDGKGGLATSPTWSFSAK
jgi:hypothetical protein